MKNTLLLTILSAITLAACQGGNNDSPKHESSLDPFGSAEPLVVNQEAPITTAPPEGEPTPDPEPTAEPTPAPTLEPTPEPTATPEMVGVIDWGLDRIHGYKVQDPDHASHVYVMTHNGEVFADNDANVPFEFDLTIFKDGERSTRPEVSWVMTPYAFLRADSSSNYLFWTTAETPAGEETDIALWLTKQEVCTGSDVRWDAHTVCYGAFPTHFKVSVATKDQVGDPNYQYPECSMAEFSTYADHNYRNQWRGKAYYLRVNLRVNCYGEEFYEYHEKSSVDD